MSTVNADACSYLPVLCGVVLAVLLAGASGVIKVICIAVAFLIAIGVWLLVFWRNPKLHRDGKPDGGEDKKES